MKPRFENEMDVSIHCLPLHLTLSEIQLRGSSRILPLYGVKNYAEEIAGLG